MEKIIGLKNVGSTSRVTRRDILRITGMDNLDFAALVDASEVKQAVDTLNIVVHNLSQSYSKILFECNVNVSAAGVVSVSKNWSEIIAAYNADSRIIFKVSDLKHEINFTAEAGSFRINNQRVFVAQTTYRGSTFGQTEPDEKDKRVVLFVWGYLNSGQTETKGAIHIVDDAEFASVEAGKVQSADGIEVTGHDSTAVAVTVPFSDDNGATFYPRVILKRYAGNEVVLGDYNASDVLFEYNDTQVRLSDLIQALSGKESVPNKVTSLSSNSTDTQYPSAKCVYDAIQTELGSINTILTSI